MLYSLVYIIPQCFHQIVPQKFAIVAVRHRPRRNHPNVQFRHDKPRVKCVGKVELLEKIQIVDFVSYVFIENVRRTHDALKQSREDEAN
jgi:hypothetical protein